MKEVSIEFENCYGIGKIEHVFNFSNTNTFLIYAPNGTMKTSFAKTFRYFSVAGGKNPCDQIYADRVSKFELKFDGAPISPIEDRILVIDPEIINFDASHRISNFVASKELKQNFDAIYNGFEDLKTGFIKKLKITSQSSDCESELITTFRQDDKEKFFDILNRVSPLLSIEHEKYDFRYNDIFDKKGNVKRFLEKHQADLDVYVQNYNSLISKSSFFKKSSNSFGTYQANEILTSVEDGSFFEAGHTLDLNGNIKINSPDDLKNIVETEISKIVNDENLKKIFDKVDKAIGSNAELRAFKLEIDKNNLLLVELKDYEEFKKKTWLSYLYELKNDTLSLHSFYCTKKEDLNLLFSKAKEELDIWKELINQFNARFHVPFTVELANQEDVILKEDLAVLNFIYSDRDGQNPTPQEKNSLFNDVLSRGEKRAFYILQILFEIESRKLSGDQTLIIFDDVADSFDYKNKYAIIEYIKDLEESGQFKIFILTHNFDFYRTITSRLNLSRAKDINAVLMATREENGDIVLNTGQYVKDVFQHFLGRSDEEKVFISLIPFLRNILEYTEGDDALEYELLTKCLHKKIDTDRILVSDILDIWNQKFPKYQSKFRTIKFTHQKVIDLIYSIADHIIVEKISNEIPLENKIVLSIAIRLKAEEFMINNITNLKLEDIESNQTQELFSLYKQETSAVKEKIRILSKVVLMTPENIHLNAFMYEPLIDISLWHLIALYKEVKIL